MKTKFNNCVAEVFFQRAETIGSRLAVFFGRYGRNEARTTTTVGTRTQANYRFTAVFSNCVHETGLTKHKANYPAFSCAKVMIF